MKKLFTGKFGRIPVAVLLTVLLTVIIAGGVVAATGGYTLWSGDVEITVDEPITIYCCPDIEPCDTEIGLEDPIGSAVNLWPGECVDTYFTFVSDSPYDLLIKAEVVTSDDSVVDVTFSSPGILTDGIPINSGGTPVTVLRTVCVDGAADLGVYTVTTTFTRESPPPPTP